MALYPSLEDMVVDQMMTAQSSTVPSSNSVYPGLINYMGLEFSEATLRENLPEYAMTPISSNQISSSNTLISPLSSSIPSTSLTHSVRQIILCKDSYGKIGLLVKSLNTGIFVSLVVQGSSAALGGLRFGDQILQINGQDVAGLSDSKVHKLLKTVESSQIYLALRDRPFESSFVLHKDSAGTLGLSFKKGKIVSIAVNSSASRNGLLIDHNIIEINDQNVVSVNDKDIQRILDDGGPIIKLTVMPSPFYTALIKNVSSSMLKNTMDHSVIQF